MSTFKVNISLEASFTSQELADFFAALAKSEKGDMQPLVQVLHPIEPPPPPAPRAEPISQEEEQAAAVEQPPAPAPAPVPAPVPASVPATRNTQWERCDITLVDDTSIETITQAITTGEFISPAESISWLGPKHNPRSQHNQRIFAVLRPIPNRTLSFTSLTAQTGIDKIKMKWYLREMEKQGFVKATRRAF